MHVSLAVKEPLLSLISLNQNQKQKLQESVKLNSSPIVKFVIILFALSGISTTQQSKVTRIGTLFVFYAGWIIGAMKAASCIAFSDDMKDFYGGMIASKIFSMILWWYMHLKRFQLFEVVNSLVSKSNRKSETRIVMWMFIVSILLFPPFIWLVAKLNSRQFYNPTNRSASCRNYWIPTTYNYISSIVVGVEFLHYYTTYITCFVVTLFFCICCVLILQKLRDSRVGILLDVKSISADVKIFQNFMTILKSFRSIISFPIFIVFCQIALDAFIVVSLYASNFSKSLQRYKYTTPQTTMWFLFVVYYADVIQAKSLQFVQLMLREMEASSFLKRKLNYFDYKEMKKCCSLTAWDIWIIDRKLLLTSVATLVTYGVIISELKH